MRAGTLVALLAVLTTQCGDRPRSSFACGAMALAGATILLDEFARDRQALSVPPRGLPEFLPVRVAAGPALRGRIEVIADSTIAVTVEGTVDTEPRPTFGVLAVGPDGRARGVMLYGGRQVAGAPILGEVRVDGLALPLIGIQTDLGALENPDCPFFPDSLALP